MFFRFVLVSAPLATLAVAALVGQDTAFAVDGDAAGNALRFMLWGLIIALSGGVTISAHLYLSAGRTAPRDAARRVVRRRVIL